MVMGEPTLFERIIQGEVPGNFISKGKTWSAFLDVFPRAEGHTLVVPNRPVQRIAGLSTSETTDLFEGLKQVQRILTDYFKTTDFTVVVHDGPLAGQEIPHIHIHVIPRTEGDNGLALPAIFPHSSPPIPPDFEGLRELCKKILGVE